MKALWKRFLKAILVLILFLIALQRYAFYQWPKLSDVSLSFVNGEEDTDPKAYETLTSILRRIPSTGLDDEVSYHNYRDVYTDLWRMETSSLERLEDMKEFSHLGIPSHIPKGDAILNITKLCNLFQLNEMKTWDFVKKGKINDAIEQIYLSLHVSYLMRNAPVSSFDMLVSNHIQMKSLFVVQKILEEQAWESMDVYLRVLSILQAIDDERTLMNGIRYDAESIDRYLRDGDGFFFQELRQEAPFWAYLYDLDASRAAAALYFQNLLSESEKDFAHRTGMNSIDFPVNSIASTLYNPYGANILRNILLNDMELLVEEEWLIAKRRVLITLCAARLYMWTHNGTVPKTAEDLVPQFLTEIPLDPFGTQSILMHKGFVFSIGKDIENITPQIENIGFLFQKIERRSQHIR